MAETLKRLGATVVVATVNTLLYQCPTGKTAVVNVTSCNRGATDRTIRIAHIDGAGIVGIATEDYLLYDAPIQANGSVNIMGITMGPLDSIMVRANHADINFVAHGSEIT